VFDTIPSIHLSLHVGSIRSEKVISDHAQYHNNTNTNAHRKLSQDLVEIPRYYLRIFSNESFIDDTGNLMAELESVLSWFFNINFHIKHIDISCIASSPRGSRTLSSKEETYRSSLHNELHVCIDLSIILPDQGLDSSESTEDMSDALNVIVHDTFMTEDGKKLLLHHIISRSNSSSFQNVTRLLVDEENQEVDAEEEERSGTKGEPKGNDHRLLSMMFGISLIVIAGTSLGGWAYILYMRCEYRKEQDEDERKVKGSNGKSFCCKAPTDYNQGDVTAAMSSSMLERSPNSDKNTWGSTIISFDYSIDGDLNSEEDNFGKELQTAARVDQHTWQTADAIRKSIEAKKKHVPLLQPPSRDVTYVHPISKPHHRYEHIDHQSPIISNQESMSTPNQYRYDITTITPDPKDVVNDESISSDTTGSYTGKDSSVEEGDRSSMGNISIYTDEMNTYLLSSRKSINESTDVESGIGSSQRSDNESGIHGGRQGFHVIQNGNSMEEAYIPREEYEAAVEAAQSALTKRQETLSSISTATGKILKLNIAAPSDELHGTFTPKGNYKGSATSFEDSDPAACSTSVSSASFSTALQSIGINSTGRENESHLSMDVFKELKNISVFLKRYEKKRSRKEQKLIQDSNVESEAWRSLQSDDDDTTEYGANASSDVSTLDSSRPSLRSESEISDRKRLFRRPSFVRKKKQSDKESLTKLEAKINLYSQTKEARARQLPPRYPDEQRQQIDDRVALAPSSINNKKSSSLSSQHQQTEKNIVSISLDRNICPSFPLQLPTSLEVSNEHSSSIEDVENQALDKFLQEDPSFDIPIMDAKSSYSSTKKVTAPLGSPTEKSEGQDSQNRMGITPPNSKTGEKPMFPINKLIDLNLKRKPKSVDGLVEAREILENPEMAGNELEMSSSSYQNRIEKNFAMQTNANSVANISGEDTTEKECSHDHELDTPSVNSFENELDRAASQIPEVSPLASPKKLSASQITKNALESGARTIISMLESKLPQSQKSSQNTESPQKPSSSTSSLYAQPKISTIQQEKTNTNTSHHDVGLNIVSPASLSNRRSILSHSVSEEKIQVHVSTPMVSPSPVSGKKTMKATNARSLISMFESNVNRAAQSSGIFPKSEYWQ